MFDAAGSGPGSDLPQESRLTVVSAEFLMIQGHFEVRFFRVIKSGEPCDCHSVTHKLYNNVLQNLRSFLIPSLVV